MIPPILFEDAEALVIDKPAGLPLDPPRVGGASLADHGDNLRLGFARRPVPVHRLDTDTSGCLLLARNPRALKRFSQAFAERSVEKLYLGIIAGTVGDEEGTVALALAKVSSASAGWRMVVARAGKPAITHWRRLGEVNGRTLIAFRPETGRTHQIRVHAAHALAPLVGDPVYGDAHQAPRTMLHAAALTVPRIGKPPVHATAAMPADFRALGFADAG